MTVTPTLGAAEAYVDNITLAPPGHEQDDFVTEVTPGIGITRTAPRLSFALGYQLQYLKYAQHPEHDDTFHQANANFLATLLPEWLYLKGDGSYSQQVISPSQPVPIDNLGVTQNLNDATISNIGPYIDHRFGPNLQLRAQYEAGHVDYRSRSVADSERTLGLFRLRNDPQSVRHWSLQTSRRELHESGQTVVLEQSFGQLGRQLSGKLAVDARLGYENNDYPAAAPGNHQGSFWAAGFTWQPTPLTQLETSYGRHFYGRSGTMRLTTDARRFTAAGDYTEEFTNGTESLLVAQANGEAPTPIPTNSGLDTEIYLRRRIGGQLDFSGARSKLTLSGFREDRDYQVTQQQEKVRGAGVHFHWQFGGFTALNSGVDWAHQRFRGGVSQRTWFGLLGLERQFTPRVSATLNWQQTQRDTTELNGDYRQNVVMLSAKAKF